MDMWSPSHSVQLLTHCTEMLDFHTTPHVKLLPTSKDTGLTLEVKICPQGTSPETLMRVKCRPTSVQPCSVNTMKTFLLVWTQ